MRAALAALVAAALAAPWTAAAATQIGETFSPDFFCNEGTFIQSDSPAEDSYAAPFAGVITAWSFQADGTAPTLKLKVARPASGDSFTIVGESPLKSPPSNELSTYTDVQISVQAGDVLGLRVAVGGQCGTGAGSAGHQARGPGPDAPPGPAPVDFGPSFNFRLDVSAALEPDCDEDGLGDETQDSALPFGGGCPKADRTLTLDSNKGKVEKKKKVRLSGQLEAAGNAPACESGQTVEILRTGLKGGTPKPVTTDQTDAQGNFATKVKVRKSSLYTGEVDESSACERETSDTEKVRVQKPKAAKEA